MNLFLLSMLIQTFADQNMRIYMSIHTIISHGPTIAAWLLSFIFSQHLL